MQRKKNRTEKRGKEPADTGETERERKSARRRDSEKSWRETHMSIYMKHANVCSHAHRVLCENRDLPTDYYCYYYYIDIVVVVVVIVACVRPYLRVHTAYGSQCICMWMDDFFKVSVTFTCRYTHRHDYNNLFFFFVYLNIQHTALSYCTICRWQHTRELC